MNDGLLVYGSGAEEPVPRSLPVASRWQVF